MTSLSPLEANTMKFLGKVNAFLNDESGPTAVEYAVMLALILVACITIVRNLGVSAASTFSTVNSALPSGGSGS